MMDSSVAPRKPAKLSQSALDVVATEPTETAFSPIVVSGVVRTIEFLLIILIGSALYWGYVGPVMKTPWVYA
ncbi:MAG: undecaprenyl-phosphate glucose phosphotransferase, partial [Pseudorhodoplanes sp.]